jgi:hypothetical protein
MLTLFLTLLLFFFLFVGGDPSCDAVVAHFL